MEASHHMNPRISIILAGMLGGESVGVASSFWLDQEAAEFIEVIIPCPDSDRMAPVQGKNVMYLDCKGLLLHEARAKAIRACRGDFVLLAEDHSIPRAGAIASLLERIDEGWDLVGPVLFPGTNRTVAAQAAFLLGYGQWMLPSQTRTVNVLPAHNVMLRTSFLRDIDDVLENEILMASFLIRRLCRTNRALLDRRWEQVHYDPPGLWREIATYWTVGLGFGAARTKNWPAALRLVYPVLVPVAIARHWLRGLVGYFRAGKQANMPVSTVAVMSIYTIVTGFGEAIGGVLGTRRVAPQVWKCEVKPVTREAISLG